MDELWVKAAVLSRVREAAGRRRKPVVSAEFTLGGSGVRADLVVFHDDFIGLEIKTERDSLRRLPSQMAAYCRYFHRAVAIVAPCHVRSISLDTLHGASLWMYDDHGSLHELHRGHVNDVSASTLEAIMTQAERRKFNFVEAMTARYEATSKAFWSAVARRPIKADDLKLLSRFVDGRERAKQMAAQREAQWSSWLAAQGF